MVCFEQVYQGPIFHTDTQSPKVTFVGCAEKCPGNCINDVQIWTYYDSFDNEHIHDSKILLKCAKGKLKVFNFFKQSWNEQILYLKVVTIIA